MERFLFTSLSKIFLLFSVLIFSTGCFPPPKPTPPVFSLYGHQGLVILPFDNVSADPALAQELQNNLTAQLVGLNAVPVYEQGAVSNYLNQISNDSDDPSADPAVIQRLSQHFKADLILTGTVETYVESTQVQPPQRIQTALFSTDNKWGYYTVQQVKITANAKIVNAANGSTIWVKNAWGNGQNQVWTDIPYPGEKTDPPAEGWDDYFHHHDHPEWRHHNEWDHQNNSSPVVTINLNTNGNNSAPSAPALLYQTDATFSNLRGYAIAQTANWMSDDFKGHGGWTLGYVAPAPAAGQ